MINQVINYVYVELVDWIHVIDVECWDGNCSQEGSQVFLVVQLVHDELGDGHGEFSLAFELFVTFQFTNGYTSQAREKFLNGGMQQKVPNGTAKIKTRSFQSPSRRTT